MNIQYKIAIKQLPYDINSENKINFTSAEFGAFLVNYYGDDTKYQDGHFDWTQIDRATLTITSINDTTLNTKSFCIKIPNISYPIIFRVVSYNFGGDSIIFHLIIDYWTTYWDKLQFLPDTQYLVNKKHIDRFVPSNELEIICKAHLPQIVGVFSPSTATWDDYIASGVSISINDIVGAPNAYFTVDDKGISTFTELYSFGFTARTGDINISKISFFYLNGSKTEPLFINFFGLLNINEKLKTMPLPTKITDTFDISFPNQPTNWYDFFTNPKIAIKSGALLETYDFTLTDKPYYQFNFANGNFYNSTPEVEKYKPVIAWNDYNAICATSISKSYSYNHSFARFTNQDGPVNPSYCYALITLLSSWIDTSTIPDNKITSLKGYVNWQNELAVPMFIAPLTGGPEQLSFKNMPDNTIELLLNVGSPCIINIFSSPYPLINDRNWTDNLKKLSDIFSPDSKVFYAGLENVFAIPYELSDFFDNLNSREINLKCLYDIGNIIPRITKTDIVNAQRNNNLEPKLWMKPHFSSSLNRMDATVELPLEYIFTDTQIFEGAIRQFISPSAKAIAIFPLTGKIKNCKANDKGNLISPIDNSVMGTSSAAAKYIQDNKNTNNTSLWGADKQHTFATANNWLNTYQNAFNSSLAGGMATGAKDPLNALGGAVGGGVNAALAFAKGGVNQAQIDFTRDLAHRQSDSNIQDLQNNPMTVKNSGADDLLGIVCLNKSSNFYDVGDGDDRTFLTDPPIYFNFLMLSDEQKAMVANEYYLNGYVINQLMPATKDLRSRHYFDYIRINNIKDTIDKSSIPVEAIDYFHKVFTNGVRLWHQDTGGWLNYDKENYERSIT